MRDLISLAPYQVLSLRLAVIVRVFLDRLHGHFCQAIALAKHLQFGEELVQHLARELRTTSYLLHPPLLDETGISSALSWYVQGLEERSSLEIDLKVAENFGRVRPQMELFIFRLVQECLTNIHRHSGSKTALIRIEREGNTVQVKVEDHGKRISPERLG